MPLITIPEDIRKPVYSGYLVKQGGQRKSWKTRFVALYPHLMVYYENNTKFQFDVSRNTLENRKNFVSLAKGTVKSIESSDTKLRYAFSLRVESEDNKRSTYVFTTINDTDRDIWMEKVQEAIATDPAAITRCKTVPVNYYPNKKLLHSKSTLRIIDNDTALSVLNSLKHKDVGSESDNTDTEEDDNQKHTRSRSQMPSQFKPHSSKNVLKTSDSCVSEDVSIEAMVAKQEIETKLASKAVSKDDSTISSISMCDVDSNPSIAVSTSNGANSIDNENEIIIQRRSSVHPGATQQVMLGKEGYLHKQGGKYKTWRHRYMVAIPGHITYYKSPPGSGGNGDKVIGSVKLKNVICVEISPLPKYPFLFEMNTNSAWNKRSNYIFSAPNEHSRREWMEALVVLGGDCKGHLEDILKQEQSSLDPFGPEHRAKSFMSEVSQSIDDHESGDEDCPKKKTIDSVDGHADVVPKIELLNQPISNYHKTNRLSEKGHDFDLSYITPRILAMSFPETSPEKESQLSEAQNNMEDIERFLNERYNTKYRVYNLCKERDCYPNTHFNGNIRQYYFEDHCAPHLLLIKSFLDDMQQWLGQDKDNVSVIHCNSGKGRTGCLICCYLVYTEDKFSTAAINLFNQKRINYGRGLSVPSQLLYIRYVEKILISGTEYAFDKQVERTLNTIQLHVPLSIEDFKPYVTINSVKDGIEIYNSLTKGDTFQNYKTKTITIRNIEVSLQGDMQVNIWNWDDESTEDIFELDAYFFFNTMFIKDAGLFFTKKDLDKLYKSKMQGFNVTLNFKTLEDQS